VNENQDRFNKITWGNAAEFSGPRKSRMVSGAVKFDPARVTIEIKHEFSIYEIDVERIRDSAEALDWILQIAMKRWATPEILHDLVHVIDEACREVFNNTAQGVFCPCGINKTVKWPVATAEALNRDPYE